MNGKQSTRTLPAGQELKQERAIQTRAQVLTAAAELLSAKGYRNTSMQDVADRVGMTKGAVYFHFRSKEALAVAVVQHHYGQWPNVAENIRASGLGPLDTVEELLNRAATAFQKDPVMQAGARLQLERPLIDTELPQPYVDWTTLLTQLFAEAESAGELRPGVSPEAAARTVVGAFFGMQHISDTLTHRADLHGRWGETRDILFHSLRAGRSAEHA
ncbi:ScbR family autoregulator-binding transcription factor [Streptomyces broussonetiae]|uniref:ScbR family autoregulator-binding transcription factor n=1 Tax=Streptomyces broussonetiae TaxID=2686304 RepID=UPI0035DA2D2B